MWAECHPKLSVTDGPLVSSYSCLLASQSVRLRTKTPFLRAILSVPATHAHYVIT